MIMIIQYMMPLRGSDFMRVMSKDEFVRAVLHSIALRKKTDRDYNDFKNRVYGKIWRRLKR